MRPTSQRLSTRVSRRLPVSGADWRLLARTLRLVLSIPAYTGVAVVAGVASLALFVFSQNLSLVSFALTGPLPLENRMTILLEQFPFVGTSYTLVTGLALLVVAGLVGANVSLVTYHLREHRVGLKQGSGSLVGVVLGVVGAGCAACGSAILAGVLSLVGATGLLTAFPYEGLEFSGLAVLALLLSMYWLADGMRGGEIRGCPIDIR